MTTGPGPTFPREERITHHMETKLFTKNDNSFICEHCGREVLPLGYSSRNHCPFCLWSKHLDINPGDRASGCGGLLLPVHAEISSKKGYVIVHKCAKCGEIHKNKAADDDNISLIIKLTATEF